MECYKKLCYSHDFIVAQETHGTEYDLATLQHELPHHVHYGSTIADRHAGDVCMSIRRHILAEHFTSHFVQELIPGRLLKLHASGCEGDQLLLAVHLA